MTAVQDSVFTASLACHAASSPALYLQWLYTASSYCPQVGSLDSSCELPIRHGCTFCATISEVYRFSSAHEGLNSAMQ